VCVRVRGRLSLDFHLGIPRVIRIFTFDYKYKVNYY